MRNGLRVLIATDAFPPICGGSGWSTYELARALRQRGHDLTIVQPRPTPGSSPASGYDGFEVEAVPFHAPSVPYLRNYVKNERLTARLRVLFEARLREGAFDLVHTQHVLTTPAAVTAARSVGLPVVCTVRDYWPVCYWSDLIHDYDADSLCPSCTAGMMTRCVRPRAGSAWPLAIPMIPYMRANLSRKRRALAGADAIVAVSSTIARDLRDRAPELSAERLHVIPNPVDLLTIREAAASTTRSVDGNYVIYVGKLAPNKGVSRLLSAVRDSGLALPLVIVGDGPLRRDLEEQARSLGLAVTFTGWLHRPEALALLAGATFLVFPSFGPESLSRVLLEAAALGIPAAAVDTGGTRDIITHEVTGLLCRSTPELADPIARLAGDERLRRRLGEAVRRHVEDHFAAPHVAKKMEDLYRGLLEARS